MASSCAKVSGVPFKSDVRWSWHSIAWGVSLGTSGFHALTLLLKPNTQSPASPYQQLTVQV